MTYQCTTPTCQHLSPSSFWSYFGQFVNWASQATGVPMFLIVTQWYEESQWGEYNICPAQGNNPANYGNTNTSRTNFANFCDGVLNGYINQFNGDYTNYASDANGRTISQYIIDAYNSTPTNPYIVPKTTRGANGVGTPVYGAGTALSGWEAACAALGSVGWADSQYYSSGNPQPWAGNILYNWYNDYFTTIVSTSAIGTDAAPLCCGYPTPTP